MSIQRVPVCTSIFVSGISDNTTHDAIELYFESQRNNGGPVEEVQFQPNSGRAVVVFQNAEGLKYLISFSFSFKETLGKCKKKKTLRCLITRITIMEGFIFDTYFLLFAVHFCASIIFIDAGLRTFFLT